MLIKVCGMRDPNNIRAIAEAGADMMGFIFYEKSPRNVGMYSSCVKSVSDCFEGATSSVANHLGASGQSKKIGKVGVFVDEMPQNILICLHNFGLDYIQLHGNESTIMIENMRRTIVPDINPAIKIIKTISICEEADFNLCKQYEGIADMFLFDTKTNLMGGCGQKFCWEMLNAYKGNTPFILSGGITPDDAHRIMQIKHPMFVGIDINSKFETAPGMKDEDKVKSFIKEIRSLENR